ncbi:hypothetical protein [Phocaeicola massiliensis]|jgi:hypothetical protein|uniref:hypothetical protein n=1 Tax=Phocaeicola massiliensis TaxID=204516 RepID=UPI0026F673FD|nr:hypothetical protein [Peptoniphilus sp.]
MKKNELIDFLILHNKWRRGADIPMKSPKDIGMAIEAVVAVLKGFDNDVVDFILKDYEFTNK